ncbi:hypothetical protein AKJ37_04965 [candidate division MSBL1 archaeon SCGC-AAA259I09]|uniref:Type I restriction modification DNA specificity domain-containing protein n=2 Tax=candidate division MSBL1 TaxID=215777 RepID=A0A133UR09_9EURY|nr:hypothetical protein AKJ61_04095 [candidate division MSBL1 archaeon SCGC-AAA259B11]KXA96546.1 hypothetical protein AKJ37_04965 [candidate division MSBL1 archaeon SCGC-AAA259I09]
MLTPRRVLRPRKDHISSKYLYYFLHSEFFITHTIANSYGAKIPRTSWNKLASYHFCFPDLHEQQAIVNFLDKETSKIDELLEKKEDLIDFLEEKKEFIPIFTIRV